MIKHLLLNEIASYLHADLMSEDLTLTITDVFFDTRNPKKNSLFVPIVGTRDGHEYIEQAEQLGAVATFVDKQHKNIETNLAKIVVDDTQDALQQLAKYYLNIIHPKVVAVTGSNGKTTTKDILASLLSAKYAVHKTQENFNNEIGVPMTILTMPEKTQVLVVELGMDRPGQISALSKLVQPNVAVINMIGEAHIEFFKTREKIADAKMEIIDGIVESGTLVISKDEPLLVNRTEEMPKKINVVFFGNQSSKYEVVNETLFDFSSEFTVNKWPNLLWKLPLFGSYNITNALAAIAASDQFDIDATQMAQKLNETNFTKNRTQKIELTSGAQMISDVYNSNPTALKETVIDFMKTKTIGSRFLVLGDMLELGEQSGTYHSEIAEYIDPKKIKKVFLIGSMMNGFLAPKLQKKMGSENVFSFKTDQLEELSKKINEVIHKNDIILLKASHGIHLEEVVNDLTRS